MKNGDSLVIATFTPSPSYKSMCVAPATMNSSFGPADSAALPLWEPAARFSMFDDDRDQSDDGEKSPAHGHQR